MKVTQVVATEAKAFADDYLAALKTGQPFSIVPHTPLDPEAPRALLQWALKGLALSNPANLNEVCHLARNGLDDARTVLTEIIGEITSRGEPLPAVLVGYNLDAHQGHLGPKRSGRRKASNVLQNIASTVLVALLMERFGLRPTRHPLRKKAGAGPSACSIVADALSDAHLHRGGERAVMEVWRKWSPRVLDGWRWQGNFIPNVPNNPD